MDTPIDNAPKSPTPKFNWESLRLAPFKRKPNTLQNVNVVENAKLTPLDKIAIMITDKVGSMGFFLIILGWTILWCGYNIIATQFPGLHFKSFDPFPAFVAYLLISNVVQILLMPLIMVGQNLQGRHSEIRAQLDFEINEMAEEEVTVILKHLEHNTDLMIQLMKHLDCKISTEELRAVEIERKIAEKLLEQKPSDLAHKPAADPTG